VSIINIPVSDILVLEILLKNWTVKVEKALLADDLILAKAYLIVAVSESFEHYNPEAPFEYAVENQDFFDKLEYIKTVGKLNVLNYIDESKEGEVISKILTEFKNGIERLVNRFGYETNQILDPDTKLALDSMDKKNKGKKKKS
jgi:hypothetical protein